MAKTRDYMDYLDEFVEISPANSEEEYQAAEVISGILKDHALETSVENFDTHPAGTVLLPILMCIMFVCMVVMGLTEGSLHYGALVLSALCAGLSVFSHFAGTNIFQNFGPASQSQNVVAVHRATGDKVVKGARPIVIVAHYDTPRESLLRKGPLTRFQASLPRIVTPLTIAIVVVVLLQAIPVLPRTIRTFLWVIGVLIALPVLFMAVIDIYGHFAPCTQGANDNKSSVAALLSIANRVRPGMDRVDRYVEDGNESLLRRVGDKPIAPPEPKYVEIVEETKGVRHGADVLLSLGILPPNCDVVYEEPRVTLVEEGAEEFGVDGVVAEETPQAELVDDVLDQLDDAQADAAVDVEALDQEEPVEEDAAPEYLEVLADPEEEDYADEPEEPSDEEDYDEDEEEIYDEEELFADDEAPNSLVDWIKERVAVLREFFSKDRGSDMDIDRGEDRTVQEDDESDEDIEGLEEEEIAFDDEEPYDEDATDEDAATDSEEYLEEDDEQVAPLSLADKIPSFDDIDEDDEVFEELDEELAEDEAYDAEEADADYQDDAEYDQTESYEDEEEEVYLEDLEPEPLEFEGEDDEYVEEEYEEEPQQDETDDEEYIEEEEEEYDESEYEEATEDDEEAYAEDESEDGDSDAYESEDEEQAADEYDDEDEYEYEYVEDDEEADTDDELADWDEEEVEEDAEDMPTRIIGPDGYDEFDLDEEEYQEDYEEYEEYEDDEEVEEEEHAPTLMERLMGFFRGLRESQDQGANGDEYEYDYDEEYEYEDDEQEDEYEPEEEQEEEYVEEFEEDDLYSEEEVADEEYAAEDDDIEPYDEVEEESPLPDDLDQIERPADPNVLHLDDYDEDSDILPRDTTGLDTISDSYDLFSEGPERIPQRDKPEPVVDPSWGVTSYQPARPAMNIARRAALLDLPDPSEAFVDPLSYVGYNGFGYDEYEDDEYDEYASFTEGVQDDSEVVSDEQAADSQVTNTVEEEQYYDESYMQLDDMEDDSVDDYDWELEEPDGEDDQGQQSFWGTNESSDWKGGATQRADLREDDGEPIIIDADSLQDAILELGDEYLVAHDIWFVATGASETDHAGIRAFMEAHKRDIRGAFLVNLDSIGAGSLSVLVREGLHVPKRADRRLVRMLTGIAQDLHIQIETAMLNWADRESTISMFSRIRSVTIMGLDENDLPANSHTQDDVPELVNPRQVSSVVRIVTELIRRS